MRKEIKFWLRIFYFSFSIVSVGYMWIWCGLALSLPNNSITIYWNRWNENYIEFILLTLTLVIGLTLGIKDLYQLS